MHYSTLFILGFILDAVDETHHGIFQCDASSMYNEKEYGPASATIDVDVKCMKDLLMVIIQTFWFLISDKPRFKGDEMVYVIPGNDLDVKCTFKANPKPTVTWTDEVEDYKSII